MIFIDSLWTMKLTCFGVQLLLSKKLSIADSSSKSISTLDSESISEISVILEEQLMILKPGPNSFLASSNEVLSSVTISLPVGAMKRFFFTIEGKGVL
ncbi:hypothetical protein [Nostoc sp.]